MSKREQLREVAKAFQQTPTAGSPSSDGDDEDLDAQIARRMAIAKGDLEPATAKVEAPAADLKVDQGLPSADAATKKEKAASAPPQKRQSTRSAAPSDTPVDATAPVPRPVVREPGDRSRIAVDVPVQFEHLRKSAKKMGMSATALVLAALREHGQQLSVRAQAGLLPVRAEAVKRWTLLLTEAELAELDRLVDEIEAGLGRRSRSAVVGLLMDELPDAR